MAPFDTATFDNVTDISEARKSKKASKSTQGSQGTQASKASKKRAPSKRNIDYEKVARLRAEIEAGTYKIDAARIADKFVEREGK